MTVSAFASSSLEFGPLVLARPLWALLLLDTWLLVGQNRRNVWFAWSMEVTSALVVLASPFLAGVLLMVLLDRQAGAAFFAVQHGGNALLYQLMFWFYSHPAVYIMVLPAFGIVSEVIPVFARKPIFGYRAMAYSMAVIAVLGFIVFVHHMFVTGLPLVVQTFFAFTTMVIGVQTIYGSFFLSMLGMNRSGPLQET